MNYYEVLEVSSNASQEVIRAAYRSLMQRYHPDRNPNDAEAAGHALRVNQAYEVLSNASMRAAYDLELKQQPAAPPIGVRDTSRPFAVRPGAADDSEWNWLVWVLGAAILAAGWFILSLSGKQSSPQAELRTIHEQASARARVEEARTIPVFIEKMTVKLIPPDNPSRSSLAEDAGKVEDAELFIPVLGIRVGTFDPDKSIAYIERNKDEILRKLAERLAFAKYEELNGASGEEYLKNMILDSIGESTGTNRREDYPPSPTETPGRYGAIDVLLPKSFSVRENADSSQPQQR